MVLSPGPNETEAHVWTSGATGTRIIPFDLERNTTDVFGNSPLGLRGMRLLARGGGTTFWLLSFLSYRLEQYDVATGESLTEIDRDPGWLSGEPGETDWRYAGLLGAHQPSADRLWVLGRSLDPNYVTPSYFETRGAPLAGRESAWDLQLELLSLPEGDVIASLSLPY
jgi:hypothetical protein